ncbi:MAG: bifunctional nuclease family protein [Bacteroidaceae bacterium]|nr:bifunctional nuclease family protein [Bacteroidaceae bacterium]MBO7248389.1 bifunctional nuclease family protein [Bacteroidaceae bacterium]
MDNKIELEVGEILNRVPSDLNLVVMLHEKGGERSLPLLVGLLEAQSIAINILKMKMPRPNIYDLYINTLDQMDASLEEVFIYKLENGVFHSHIYYSKDGNRYYIDSRTSDAVALAVRSGVAIYIDDELFENHCAHKEGNGAFSMPITIASVQVLQEAMDQAVESENYELAAKLRDEINRRNGAGNNL